MRNIILVTGPIADRKSFLIDGLQKEFAARNIPQALEIISDDKYLRDAIFDDHRLYQGVNHMHNGQQKPVIHDPDGKEGTRNDFVAAGPEIQHYTFSHFFDELASIRDSSPIVFANLTGGCGDFPSEHPLSGNDYSYQRMKNGLESGEFANGWIPNLLMVLHPASDYSARLEWNRFRLHNPPSEEDKDEGITPLGVPEIVLLNTRYDDFPVFQDFLESNEVSKTRIETIPNFSEKQLLERAMVVLENIGLPDGRRDEYEPTLPRAARR